MNETELFQETTFNQTSKMGFTPESTGVVICEASNTQGSNVVRANIIVNDLNDELIVWCDNVLPISAGDDISVTCGASAHKYATDLRWFKDDVEIQNSDSEYRLILSYILSQPNNSKLISFILQMFKSLHITRHTHTVKKSVGLQYLKQRPANIFAKQVSLKMILKRQKHGI